MTMEVITTMISTVGFPICSVIGLCWFVLRLQETNNKNIERMFTMYENSNKENREAIENNTRVLEKVCDKLDLFQNKEK